ncbi:DUF6942 family protein [Microbulbifer halophilus]|uniref:DUF6942 family protein n=1 Tax=Microbulbifer halophilus TaxID=453963 RepID=A0ABW5EK31_9GAMM|nr:hypothetical protein [Microbulbifer halophilus]MCW8128561.1 hypothetical protein [Microbulbifer halophilus]
MPEPDYLGSRRPRLVLYLPHRPKGLAQLVHAPDARALVAANSNHWRKIVTLLAKIACPDADGWRRFRDGDLFRYTGLCFAPALVNTGSWHWIGGKDNLQRFTALLHNARPLANSPDVSIDPDRRLLLTPYPDYRQLSNALVSRIRSSLASHGFYND